MELNIATIDNWKNVHVWKLSLTLILEWQVVFSKIKEGTHPCSEAKGRDAAKYSGLRLAFSRYNYPFDLRYSSLVCQSCINLMRLQNVFSQFSGFTILWLVVFVRDRDGILSKYLWQFLFSSLAGIIFLALEWKIWHADIVLFCALGLQCFNCCVF